MIFTALSKLNKISIHFIILLITLTSGSALAINEKQKAVLKQLTIEEYEKLNQELEQKALFDEAESYINEAMSDMTRTKRNKFFVTKNREIAKIMGVKAANNTAKFGIPYRLHRTFNLVQAMIRQAEIAEAEPIEPIPIMMEEEQAAVDEGNEAVSAVIGYANRWLSERAEQMSTNDTHWVKLIYEDRAFQGFQGLGTKIFKAEKNKDLNFQSIVPYSNQDHPLHLLRNDKFHLTNVNMIRKENLEDGDRIILQNRVKTTFRSPTINSASKARGIYIAVNKLREFLDSKYPDKFSLSINEENMFQVTLDFVAPYGWWKDAFFRIEFNFDNIGNEGPEIDVKYAPRVAHLFGNKLCLMQTYKNSERHTGTYHRYWYSNCSRRVRYGSDIFSIEDQILNVINFMTSDLDIKSEGFISYSSRGVRGVSPEDAIAHEIIYANTQAKKDNPLIYVETDPNKIKESVYERMKKDEEDPTFDYLVIDKKIDNPKNPESLRTDIFIPVEMHREAEIVEFDYSLIKNFHDLIYEARRKSGFKIPASIEPVVYHKNEKLDQYTYGQVLQNIWAAKEKKGKTENKHKKKNDILTMIIKVPGYEKRAFEFAVAYSHEDYFPENPRRLAHNENKVPKPKPITWEIHLVENKRMAKANNMVHQYNFIMPVETQNTTERFRSGTRYGGEANVWIPTVRDDMSDVERKFALMAMHDLSRTFLQIPSDLKKAAASNFGNNIITKSFFMPKEDDWLPTQGYLELLLQRVQMSLLISREEYSITEKNNVFFERVINGNIDKKVINDLAFFVGQLAPSLYYASRMNGSDKTEITYRIAINYLIEICVRTLTYNEFDASSGIIKQLIEKPEKFSLEDIYTANKKGIGLAFNVLQIAEFLFTKIIFSTLESETLELVVSEREVASIQRRFKSMLEIVNGKHNLIPLFLNHLLPDAKHHSSDLNFESEAFLNKFTLTVLDNYASRTKNKEVKASLQNFLKNTEAKSGIFNKERTDELISAFRENTPKLLANVPNEQGGFEQTCYHCNKPYKTEGSIRGKGRTKNRTTKKPKTTQVKPFHPSCMVKDKEIRKGARKLYKKMEEGYPKKQLYGADYQYNPVPDGFELIRINGDGNCMYSSIAEILNRNEPSGQADPWNQQKVRQRMEDNLHRIYSVIQNHPDNINLLQELELLLGIEAGVISTVLHENIITDSASFAQSELGRLQQFGDAQLMTLLVPTQGVWFPVITQGHNGAIHEIYDLRRWVNFAPNLLAILLQNKNYTFPDLTEDHRKTLLLLLLIQNFDQAALFVSEILIDPHQSSAYLIHYPSSVALLEHFDAAVSSEATQSMEVDPPQTAQLDAAFHDPSHDPSNDESNKRIKLDPDSSVSNNETDRETQDSNPLWIMIQAVELLTTPGTPTHSQ